MADRKPSPDASLPRERRNPDVPLAGTGIAPVAPDAARPVDTGEVARKERPLDTDEEAPRRGRNFQKRLAQEVEHTLQEHPDGSAPPLDRLTQDLDPRKDL